MTPAVEQITVCIEAETARRDFHLLVQVIKESSLRKSCQWMDIDNHGFIVAVGSNCHGKRSVLLYFVTPTDLILSTMASDEQLCLFHRKIDAFVNFLIETTEEEPEDEPSEN